MPAQRFALLRTVHGPQALRGLAPDQLDELSGEIRDFLVTHVSQTGGHPVSYTHLTLPTTPYV